jgi:CRISPR-associated protein Cas1
LIVHAHGVTWTTNLVMKLAERGSIMVLCAANHAPIAMTIPIDGHHAQNDRFRAQWDTPRPFLKQAWKTIVMAKVRNQASLLMALGLGEGEALSFMADRIRSGDPDNIEAQAARRYWPALMGAEFRRDREAKARLAALISADVEMRVKAEEGRGRRLAVAIDHQHAIALHAQIVRQMRGDGRFPHAALEILHSDDRGRIKVAPGRGGGSRPSSSAMRIRLVEQLSSAAASAMP